MSKRQKLMIKEEEEMEAEGETMMGRIEEEMEVDSLEQMAKEVDQGLMNEFIQAHELNSTPGMKLPEEVIKNKTLLRYTLSLMPTMKQLGEKTVNQMMEEIDDVPDGRHTSYTNLARNLQECGKNDTPCISENCIFTELCKAKSSPLYQALLERSRFQQPSQPFKPRGMSFRFENEWGKNEFPPSKRPRRCVLCELYYLNHVSRTQPGDIAIFKGFEFANEKSPRSPRRQEGQLILNRFSVMLGQNEFCESSLDKPHPYIRGSVPILDFETMIVAFSVPDTPILKINRILPQTNVAELVRLEVLLAFIPSWPRFLRLGSAEDTPFIAMRPVKDLSPFRHVFTSPNVSAEGTLGERLSQDERTGMQNKNNNNSSSDDASNRHHQKQSTFATYLESGMALPFSSLVEFFTAWGNFPLCLLEELDSNNSSGNNNASSSFTPKHVNSDLLHVYTMRVLLCPLITVDTSESSDPAYLEAFIQGKFPSLSHGIIGLCYKNHPPPSSREYYMYYALLSQLNWALGEMKKAENMASETVSTTSTSIQGTKSAYKNWSHLPYMSHMNNINNLKKLDPLLEIYKQGYRRHHRILKDSEINNILHQGEWKAYPDFITSPQTLINNNKKNLKDHLEFVHNGPTLFFPAYDLSLKLGLDPLPSLPQELFALETRALYWGDQVSPLAKWLEKEDKPPKTLCAKGLDHLLSDSVIGLQLPDSLIFEPPSAAFLKARTLLCSIGLRCHLARELHDILLKHLTEKVLPEIPKVKQGDLFDREMSSGGSIDLSKPVSLNLARTYLQAGFDPPPLVSLDSIKREVSGSAVAVCMGYDPATGTKLEEHYPRLRPRGINKEPENPLCLQEEDEQREMSSFLAEILENHRVEIEGKRDPPAVADDWPLEPDLERAPDALVPLLKALLDLKIFVASHTPLLSLACSFSTKVEVLTNEFLFKRRMSLNRAGIDKLACTKGVKCSAGCTCEKPFNIISEDNHNLGPSILEMAPCLPELVSSERTLQNIIPELSRILNAVDPPVNHKEIDKWSVLRYLVNLFNSFTGGLRFDHQTRDYWMGREEWLMNSQLAMMCGHMRYTPMPMMALSSLMAIDSLKARRQDPPHVHPFRKGEEADTYLGVGKHINPRSLDPSAPNITWSTRAKDASNMINADVDGLSGFSREWAMRHPSLMELSVILWVAATADQAPWLKPLLREKFCGPETFFNCSRNTALSISVGMRPDNTMDKATIFRHAEEILKSQIIMRRQKVPELSLNTQLGIMAGYTMLRLNFHCRLMREVRTPGGFTLALRDELESAAGMMINGESAPSLTKGQQIAVAEISTLARAPGVFEPALFIMAKEECDPHPRFDPLGSFEASSIQSLMLRWLFGQQYFMRGQLGDLLSHKSFALLHSLCTNLAQVTCFSQGSLRCPDSATGPNSTISPVVVIAPTHKQVLTQPVYPYGTFGVMLDLGSGVFFRMQSSGGGNLQPPVAPFPKPKDGASESHQHQQQPEEVKREAVEEEEGPVESEAMIEFLKALAEEYQREDSLEEDNANAEIEDEDFSEEEEEEDRNETESVSHLQQSGAVLSPLSTSSSATASARSGQEPAGSSVTNYKRKAFIKSSKRTQMERLITSNSMAGVVRFYPTHGSGDLSLCIKPRNTSKGGFINPEWEMMGPQSKLAASSSSSPLSNNDLTNFMDGDKGASLLSSSTTKSARWKNHLLAPIRSVLWTAPPVMFSTCGCCLSLFWRDRMATGPWEGVRCPKHRYPDNGAISCDCAACGKALVTSGMTWAKNQYGLIFGVNSSSEGKQKMRLPKGFRRLAGSIIGHSKRSDEGNQVESIGTEEEEEKGELKHLEKKYSAPQSGSGIIGKNQAGKNSSMSSMGLSVALGLPVSREDISDFTHRSIGVKTLGELRSLGPNSAPLSPPTSSPPQLASSDSSPSSLSTSPLAKKSSQHIAFNPTETAVIAWLVPEGSDHNSPARSVIVGCCKNCSVKKFNNMVFVNSISHRLYEDQLRMILQTRNGCYLFK